MASKGQETRDKIIAAALTLLQEEPDVEQITVRRIAERAEVGLGLINYHFQSKDNLLNEAVSQAMAEAADSWLAPPADSPYPAKERLRGLLKETARIAARYPQFATIAVAHALQNGNFQVPLLVAPLLREIFGQQVDERRLRLLALQLILPLQVAALDTDAFQIYSGFDLTNTAQREAVIDLLLELPAIQAGEG